MATKPKPVPVAFAVEVWSPEGVKEIAHRQNVNDLVRHLGYTTSPPGEKVKKKKSADTSEKSPEDMLSELRREAGRLGIRVDPQWGVMRLNKEITAISQKGNVPDVVADMKKVQALQDAEDALEKPDEA